MVRLCVTRPMPWFDWWPHDPVPSSSLTDPLVVKVKRDQVNKILSRFTGGVHAGSVKLNPGVMGLTKAQVGSLLFSFQTGNVRSST